MSTRAVVFDLFGTLMPNLSHAEFPATAMAMARAVGAPIEEFVYLYGEGTYRLRFTGELPTTEANVEYVCRLLEDRPDPAWVGEAARLRTGLTRRILLAPLPRALVALAELRESSYVTGLVSDCSSEVPLLWPETEVAPLIDVPVFSCRAGFRKPDPRIYVLACEGLGVRPEECLYVADGVGNELSGALAVGMRAALIRVAYDEATDADRPEVLMWKGLELQALTDVLVRAAGGRP